MKKYIFLTSVIFLAIVALVLLKKQKPMLEGPRVRIKNASFSVEVADTEVTQEKGLGYRNALCETCGMLFVFDRPNAYGFWMKGMRFSLDILWIRAGTIIHIEQSLDFHDQQRVYSPTAPADRVLELNAGTCEKEGIREGDGVVFEKM